MKLTNTLLGIAVLISAVLAVPAALVAGTDLPYPVVPFQYDGELGGKNVSLTGSANQIIAKFNKLHPESAINVTGSATGDSNEHGIEHVPSKRNKNGPALCCNRIAQPWLYVSDPAIGNAIKTLSQFGRCVVQPRTCVRLVCGWGNAAIYLCNDRFDVIAPSCNYLATYSYDTVADCSNGGNSCGQLFDSDGYNVITRQDVSCFGGVFNGEAN